MAIVDLLMPKLGESIIDATVLKWLKQPGDTIALDEPVLEIATDKVDSEVPSTAAGILKEVLYQTNEVAPVGAVIARIETNAAATTGNSVTTTSAPVTTTPEKPQIIPPTISATAPLPEVKTIEKSTVVNRFYSPLVLNIATNEGISFEELEHINGTGADGRVSKKDILLYLKNRPVGNAAPAKTAVATDAPTPKAIAEPPANTTQVFYENAEVVEMDRMRKLIADHMVKSKQTSPHVTSFSEADVTNLVTWREKVKTAFEKRENTKITFTPIFIEAIVKCIKKFPLINSSLDGTKIIIKKDINIGMATALPSGNLIVPVIKNADQLNIVGLSKQVNALADSARNGKLKADDTAGGTFTFTNVGTFGSLMGTPIINQPQVAILAVGAIKKRPVVVETPQGDSIAIRHMMYLSLSYDHRIVDGSLGATFLTAVARELENFNPDREL